jgi:hypothetical protein
MTLITITMVHASEHHQVAEKLMALLDRQSTGRVELREFEKVTDSQSSTEAAAAITVATTNAITKKAPSSPPQPPLLLITHPFPVFLVLSFFFLFKVFGHLEYKQKKTAQVEAKANPPTNVWDELVDALGRKRDRITDRIQVLVGQSPR